MFTSGAGGVALGVADLRRDAGYVPLRLLIIMPLDVVRRIDPDMSRCRKLEDRTRRPFADLEPQSTGFLSRCRLNRPNPAQQPNCSSFPQICHISSGPFPLTFVIYSLR